MTKLPAFSRAAEAAKYLLTIKEAESSFLGFVRALQPDFVLAPFQLDLIDKLDKLEKRQLYNERGQLVRRLLITMPPRHGKTHYATTLFPTYYMARDPRRTVMSTSYNADLAKTFGRAVKDTAQIPLVQQIFPRFALHHEATAVNFWKTSELGAYFGVGLGGTTTGRAANLLIVDDPVKARQEAESAANRNATWSYYTSALLTRKQPEPDGQLPIEIFIQTRWHPDDPAGRILESDDFKDGQWLHLNYQAIDDNGNPLWPERFPIEELRDIERRDPREFAALYQQSPYIQGGNLFKTANLRQYNPADLPPLVSTIITLDTAFKRGERNDYSVLLVAGVDNTGLIYILDVIRQKLEFGELKAKAKTTYAIYRPRGIRSVHIEDKASGQSLIQELRSETALPVIPYKNPSGDKVQRAHPVTPLVDAGIVAVPADAPWLPDFVQELQAFPSSKHDDQVDAFVMALDILSRTAIQTSDAIHQPISTFLSAQNIQVTANFPPLPKPAETPESMALTSALSAYKHLTSWGE